MPFFWQAYHDKWSMLVLSLNSFFTEQLYLIFPKVSSGIEIQLAYA